MGKRRRSRRRAAARRESSAAEGAASEAGRSSDASPQTTSPTSSAAKETAPRRRGPRAERIAALDLGTNNCRLLIAQHRDGEFRIVDAFSRIVRLGEGVSKTGALSDAAMDRAMEALRICAAKIERRSVARGRYVATQACRVATNGAAFLARAKAETGLTFEIVSPEEEARLSVRGCVALLDPGADAGLIFDIGGGSTEVSWIAQEEGARRVAAWASFPVGVVTLAETWGGREIDFEKYQEIVAAVAATIRAFGDPGGLRPLFAAGRAHFLGTSGTVTSIAGVHLELPRYRRDLVDGLWLSRAEAETVTARLRGMTFDQRAAEPCIGPERADLVVCGCAILDALLLEWPSERIRVADRGLREGILADLAAVGPLRTP